MRDFFELYGELVGTEFARLFGYLFLVIYLLFAVIYVVSYIFSSIGLFRIGKRRGLKLCGMAWVPFGRVWLFGGIADQYDRRMNQKDPHRRAWFCIADIVLSAAKMIAGYAVWMRVIDFLRAAIYMDEAAILTALVSCGAALLAMLGVALLVGVFMIFYYIALYKVYRSCAPRHCGWLLAVALVLNVCGLQEAIPLFCLRNRDDGFLEEPRCAEQTAERYALYN